MTTAFLRDWSAYTISHLDGAIVYLPLRRLAFYADRETTAFVEQLTRRQEKHSSAMPVPPVLKTVDFFAPAPPCPEVLSPATAFKPTTCVLLPTTACNLRCVYCYAAPDTRGETLDTAVGKKAVDIVHDNARELGRDCFEVAFHGGGEPTSVLPILREVIEYSRTKPLSCRVSLTTNGFWNEKRRTEILDLGLSNVSVSLDGGAEVQNRQRPTAAFRPTFDSVMETIHELDRHNVAYGIRTTVIDDSIHRLPESVDDLCRNTKCRTFQVEPAFAHGRALAAGVSLTDHRRFVEAFLDAYDIASYHGRHLYYSGARPWVATSAFCLAPAQALIVTTDGQITACYEVFGRRHALAGDFFWGKVEVDNGLSLNQGARSSLLERVAERRSRCRECFCFCSCAGDCMSKAFAPGNGGHLHFGDRCAVNRAITKELLLRFVEESGGVWRGERKVFEGGCA